MTGTPLTGLHCTAHDLWVTSLTVYGEARGEPHAGQIAVAWVIRNRQEVHRRWRRASLQTICKAPRQFSCWNPGAAILQELHAVSLDTASFVACLQAAVAVLGGLVPSNVGRSTHFYAPALQSEPPAWALGQVPCVQIGGHLFFEDIP